eukprot:Skav222167  [mRNA]  locus=scaffold3048:140029:140349:- [translate_table: standard]
MGAAPWGRRVEVTAWDSDNVVVLMTQETLKRMWCAAEIASAWAAKTNIVLVSCDGNLAQAGAGFEANDMRHHVTDLHYLIYICLQYTYLGDHHAGGSVDMKSADAM